MLFPILLLYVTSYVSAKLCEKNQFWSSILEKCDNCSRCVHPDVVIRPCQGHKNTVCGPLSELNLDWSFLRHSDNSGKSSNSQKEMLQTFKENYKEIWQHEKHVREKQKYLHERLKKMKDSNEDYNEIEGGDIFVGRRGRPPLDRKEIREKLRELGRAAHESDDPSKRQKDREKSIKMFKTLLNFPAVLDSFPNNRLLHFDDDEAFELLRGGKKARKDEYDANHLKYDENGVLMKNFGFSEPDEAKVEKLVDEQKTEKLAPDWRLAAAAGLLILHTIIILIIATYCVRKNGKKIKGYFATEFRYCLVALPQIAGRSVADLIRRLADCHSEKVQGRCTFKTGEVQTWILPREKESKFPVSGIYKPTTEVRTGPGSSKCKYLERIINMNGKKKHNFYVGVKLPPEMKPLTGKYPTVHAPTVGDRV